jgi:dynein heavy chain, axonemal
MKIESHPKDIEELTTLKDFMVGVPNEIEKLQKDIKEALNIYATLDLFNYKFADDEDYGRKWKVFGSPLDTVSRIDKQMNILQVLQDKYLAQMNGSMEDFEKTINEITDQVTQFQKYQDINQYEEVSSIAKQIF